MNNFIKYLIISILFIFIYLNIFNVENKEKYNESIVKERNEKHEYFKNSNESPFFEKKFKKLNYFDPDISFKVIAKIEYLKKKDTVLLKTSDNNEAIYIKFARAVMKLKNENLNLILYKEAMNENEIFLLFNDLTNGNETYEGGRYIDFDFKNSKRIEIDFNKAYNPYCVYDIKYSCPIPPKENKIPLRILAGEKKYFN